MGSATATGARKPGVPPARPGLAKRPLPGAKKPAAAGKKAVSPAAAANGSSSPPAEAPVVEATEAAVSVESSSSVSVPEQKPFTESAL